MGSKQIKIWLIVMTALFGYFSFGGPAANLTRYACVVLAVGLSGWLWAHQHRPDQRWLTAGLVLSLITDAVLLFAPASQWVPLAVGLFAWVHWCYLRRFNTALPGPTTLASAALITGALGWLLPAAIFYTAMLLLDAADTWRRRLPTSRATWLARAGITAFAACDIIVALGQTGRIDPAWSWLFYWPALTLLTLSAN